DGRVIRDIRVDVEHVPLVLLLQCRAQVVLDVTDDYLRALSDEEIDAGEPDTAGSTGDDGYLVCELVHGVLPFFDCRSGLFVAAARTEENVVNGSAWLSTMTSRLSSTDETKMDAAVLAWMS